MGFYDRFLNWPGLFAPQPQPPISQNQGGPGNGLGSGFWNGGFLDRMQGRMQYRPGEYFARHGTQLYPGQPNGFAAPFLDRRQQVQNNFANAQFTPANQPNIGRNTEYLANKFAPRPPLLPVQPVKQQVRRYL